MPRLHVDNEAAKKLRNPGPGVWRGLGATVVMPGFVALYGSGLLVALIDEAFFEWTSEGGEWTF